MLGRAFVHFAARTMGSLEHEDGASVGSFRRESGAKLRRDLEGSEGEKSMLVSDCR